ncbi:hypothetical protein B566_EDAN005549 [Ephemera danica]|nr:hypothetical protein B566_EDAN005549 [Ephemera danica]
MKECNLDLTFLEYRDAEDAATDAVGRWREHTQRRRECKVLENAREWAEVSTTVPPDRSKPTFSQLNTLRAALQAVREREDADRGMSGTLDSFLEETLRMAGLREETQDFSIAGDSNERATLTLRKSVQISATSRAKLSIQFSLQKLAAQELFHHVTLPLTVTCWQLQKQNEELMKIIENKDSEIAEYKANNSINIARKNLITKPFNKPSFKEKHSASQIPDDLFLSPVTALGDLQEYGASWQRMETLQIVQPWSVPGRSVKTKVADVAPEPKKHKEMPRVKKEKVAKVSAPPVLLRKPKRIL